MSLSTYTGLVSAIGNFLNRPDLAASIPDFIALAEARFNRELRHPEMEAISETDAEEVVELPDDFLEARHIYLDTDPRVEIEPVSLSVLQSTFSSATTGYPRQYAISGGQMFLSPIPSDALTIVMHYTASLTPLSTEEPSNWLLAAHPDVYLFTALSMAEAFLWNDERASMWKAAADEMIAGLAKVGNMSRNSGGPLYPRVMPQGGFKA